MARKTQDSIILYHQFQNETIRFKHLRSFIESILINVFTEEEDMHLLELLLTEESLRVWEMGLTHESFDPIDNYELFEIIGDARLGSDFVNYLADKFPGEVNARNVTLSKNFYMASEQQIKMAERLQLDKMIRLGNSTAYERKMAEDLFEAFFGVLTRLIDNVEEDIEGEMVPTYRGESYKWTYELLSWILGDMNVDLVITADPITLIKEAYDILRLEDNVKAPSIVETTFEKKGKTHIRMRLIEPILNNSGERVTSKAWPFEVSGPLEEKAKLHRELGMRG